MVARQPEPNFQDMLASLQRLAENDELRRTLLEKLIATNQAIIDSINPEEPRAVLDEAVKQACFLTQADCAVLFPYDLARDDYYDPRFIVQYGLNYPEELPVKPRVDGTAATIQNENGLIINNVAEQKPELLKDGFIKRESIQAFIGIPLVKGNEHHGVLYIDFRKNRQFEEYELETYRLFAYNLALALSLSRTSHQNLLYSQKLSSLNHIGVALTSGTVAHFEQIYGLIHEQVEKLMDADNYYMALYSKEEELISFALVMEDGTPVPVNEAPYLPRKRGKGLTELIIETKKPMLARHGVGKLYEEAGRKDYVGKLAKSWIGVPILFEDQVFGVIATYNWQEEAVYDEQDLEVLQTIGTQAANALQIKEHFQSLEAINKRLEETNILNLELANRRLETGRVISQAVITELGVERILEVLRSHFKCNYAIVLLVDETREELFIHSQVGVASQTSDTLPKVPFGSGISGRVAQQNQTIRVDNVKESEYIEYIVDVQSEIATPLRNESGKVIGVLDLEHTDPNAFTKEDELLLELVAESVVLALRNIEQVEEIKQLEEKEKFSYLGVLAAGVAHKIGGSVGLMGFELSDIRKLANNLSTELEEVLARFEAERKYLRELSDVLVRPQAALEEPTEPLEVSKLMNDAIVAAQNRLKEVDLDTQNIDSLPPINGNKFLVEIFAEIIRNATKAMHNSSTKKLQIIGNRATSSDFVEIQFKDTGRGISAEQISQIFELFFTGFGEQSEGGYGLWMVKTILTGLGGNIQAISEGEGKGSIFIVHLPVY